MLRRSCLALLFAATAVSVHAESRGDPAKGQPIGSTLCAGCHGLDGTGIAPMFPNLAGQIPDYTVRQLRAYKATDDKPATRKNDIMNGMVMSLSDDDMVNLAAYFGEMKPKAGPAGDNERVAMGQKIWRAGIQAKGVPACAGCHGVSGAGLPAQYPRLAGQHADYTDAQLKAFRSGERANDPEKMMQMIAAKMSDSEMRAVAEFAASMQ